MPKGVKCTLHGEVADEAAEGLGPGVGKAYLQSRVYLMGMGNTSQAGTRSSWSRALVAAVSLERWNGIKGCETSTGNLSRASSLAGW